MKKWRYQLNSFSLFPVEILGSYDQQRETDTTRSTTVWATSVCAKCWRNKDEDYLHPDHRKQVLTSQFTRGKNLRQQRQQIWSAKHEEVLLLSLNGMSTWTKAVPGCKIGENWEILIVVKFSLFWLVQACVFANVYVCFLIIYLLYYSKFPQFLLQKVYSYSSIF